MFKRKIVEEVPQQSVRSDLSTQDVVGAAFSIEEKGYNVDEVDFLLESVVATIEKLNHEISSLREELEGFA